MPLSKNKLYLLLATGCLAGYSWLFIFHHTSAGSGSALQVCLIKGLTNMPCPSCGISRSVLLLLKGDPGAALYVNPLGILVAAILLFAPLWLAFDLMLSQESLYKAFHKGEALLKRKWMAIPLGLLVLGNWVWNIYKGL